MNRKNCSIEKCYENYFKQGFCHKHFKEMDERGEIIDKNKIVECSDHDQLSIYDKNFDEIIIIQIDKETIKLIGEDLLSHCSGLVRLRGEKLQDVIVSPKKGKVIGFKNGDYHDFRVKNLFNTSAKAYEKARQIWIKDVFINNNDNI